MSNTIPPFISQFINSNIKLLNNIYNENYTISDEDSHGIIYVKLINDNLDLAYMKYSQLIDNNILEEDLVNNIKKEYKSKKVIYINIDTNNYILLF